MTEVPVKTCFTNSKVLSCSLKVKLCFRDRLVSTVGIAVEIKLCFPNFSGGGWKLRPSRTRFVSILIFFSSYRLRMVWMYPSYLAIPVLRTVFFHAEFYISWWGISKWNNKPVSSFFEFILVYHFHFDKKILRYHGRWIDNVWKLRQYMTGFMKTVSKLCAESQLKRKKLGELKEEQWKAHKREQEKKELTFLLIFISSTLHIVSGEKKNARSGREFFNAFFINSDIHFHGIWLNEWPGKTDMSACRITIDLSKATGIKLTHFSDHLYYSVPGLMKTVSIEFAPNHPYFTLISQLLKAASKQVHKRKYKKIGKGDKQGRWTREGEKRTDFPFNCYIVTFADL